jgi:hypothetical protein
MAKEEVGGAAQRMVEALRRRRRARRPMARPSSSTASLTATGAALTTVDEASLERSKSFVKALQVRCAVTVPRPDPT